MVTHMGRGLFLAVAMPSNVRRRGSVDPSFAGSPLLMRTQFDLEQPNLAC